MKKNPTLTEEKKLWQKGYKKIVGLDEVGRGSLAGPVVAAAVMLKSLNFKIKGLRDSKKLTSKQREEFFKIFKKNKNIVWGIGRASEKEIDKINILEATKLAMVRAIKNLKKKITQNKKIDFLILDGNFKLNLKIKQKAIVKGDEKVFSCAISSVFAKVIRDRIMEKYDKKYPFYGFKKNKGYPTNFHFHAIKKYGLCKIHRRSFILKEY